MKRKPKRMKPVRAWAIVFDGNPVQSWDKCPLIYSTKEGAQADLCDLEWRIARVEIREVVK